MLTPEDQETIGTVLAEFALRGPGGASHCAELLARLPKSQESLETFIRQAQEQGLTWVEQLAATLLEVRHQGPDSSETPPSPSGWTELTLTALLDSAAPGRAKTEALLSVAREHPPYLAQVARTRLESQTDPFVLATLASVLGRVGQRADVLPLMVLLKNPDSRVVANTLEALYRHHVEVPAEVLEKFMTQEDDRVRVHALALWGIADPQRSVDEIATLTEAPDPRRRASVAYLLGELAHRARALELLAKMLAVEDQVQVLRRLASSLRRQTGPAQAAAVVARVREIGADAPPAKASLLKDLCHDLSRENGLDRPPSMGSAVRPATDPAMRLPGTMVAPVLSLTEDTAPLPGADSRTTLRTRPFDIAMARLRTLKEKVLEAIVLLRTRGGWLEATRWETSRSMVIGLGVGSVLICAAMLNGLSRSAQVLQTSMSATDAASSSASGPGQGGPTLSSEGPRTAQGSGSTGAFELNTGPGGVITLEGKVVGISSGKPLVFCGGRTYMVVTGSRPEDREKGKTLRVTGRTRGVTQDGLILVEARGL